MNILVVVAYNPFTGKNGNAIRVRAMLRELGRNGHKVSLLMYGLPRERVRKTDVPQDIRPYLLTVGPEVLLLGFFLRWLFKAPAFSLASGLLPPFRNFKRAVWNIVKKDKIDIVQCENSQTALQVERSLEDMQMPIVVSAHDVISDRYTELLDRKRSPRSPGRFFLERIRKMEFDGVNGAAVCACVSQEDRSRFVQMGVPAEKLVIVPNGVDCDAVGPGPKDTDLLEELGMGSSPVLFFGGSDQLQNTKAVDDIVGVILPGIFQSLPNAKMMFTGTVCRYVAARGFDRLYPQNIANIGYVEHVRNYYSLVDVVLLPITTGTGTKLKAAEAFAAGKPIVSTSLGVKGYDVTGGEDVIIEDDLHCFPTHILALLGDAESRLRLGARVREKSRNYDWGVLMRRYEDIYGVIMNASKMHGSKGTEAADQSAARERAKAC